MLLNNNQPCLKSLRHFFLSSLYHLAKIHVQLAIHITPTTTQSSATKLHQEQHNNMQ